jgi:hypothetical protein
MKHGYQCCIGVKDWLFLERGQSTALIRKGIDDRFQMDTDRTEGICYSDYRGNGSRVIFIPLTTPEVVGDSGVWATSISAFFIKYRLGTGTGASLVGEFVYAVTSGTPNGHPETGGPVTFALHLIR